MAYVVKVSISIARPAALVWEVLMDPESLQHWLTGFISLTHLSGNRGEPGSTSTMKLKESGREIEVLETILLLEPIEHCRFRMEHKTFETENDLRLISFGDRTELIQTVQLFPKGILLKLMLPFAGGHMKKVMTTELLKFKSFVETR